MKKFQKKIVLASKSPRRKEIMELTPWEFEVDAVDIDETMDKNLGLVENLMNLAQKKAQPIANKYPDSIVIGSDTIVCVDDEILGKPKDESEARSMLQMLSGREHSVFTGVSIQIINRDVKITLCEETKVYFKNLTESEISWYIKSGEPFGKAGSYGIQGKAGLFVEKIDGDYYNVVGLPLNKLYEELNKL